MKSTHWKNWDIQILFITRMLSSKGKLTHCIWLLSVQELKAFKLWWTNIEGKPTFDNLRSVYSFQQFLDRKKTFIKEDLIWSVLTQFTNALHSLSIVQDPYRSQIFHRCLKPSSVYLNSHTQQIKIGDFGLGLISKPYYMCPVSVYFFFLSMSFLITAILFRNCKSWDCAMRNLMFGQWDALFMKCAP